MMNGRIVRILLGTVLALCAAVTFAQTGITVNVNGDVVQFAGTAPQMVNGRVLVPLRGIFEKLGASVEWHPDRQEVIATRGSDTIDLIIGNPNATVNGRSVTLDVPAQIVNGSTMVPIRFVSEAMGAEVGWQEATQTVTITSSQDQPAEPAPDRGDTGSGPVRMARISLLEGVVSWRPGDDVDWSDAATNLPLRQGAQIWLSPNARAEIQFDDGSLLRLGQGAVATLFTMFADGNGEFTEIRLNTGTASLRLTTGDSKYQVDTPLASVTASGPADLRIDGSINLRVIVRSGQAQVQGDLGPFTINEGQLLRLSSGDSRYTVLDAPDEDDWDSFCDRRNDAELHPSSNLPPSIGLVAGDLDSYGSWSEDSRYGHCWHPNGTDANWAPYRSGHWVWVSPFGWTWCATEAWGWAPYHYGTWFYGPGGWYWSPGPPQQYWSPAVVHFSTQNGVIGWCALSPSEVHYPPTIPVGYRGRDWDHHFSIEGTASYYADGPSGCSPRPWTNSIVNRPSSVTSVSQIVAVQNGTVPNNGFVPRNSRIPGGATLTTTDEFAGRGNFRRSSAAESALFVKGQSFAPPASGSVRYAGPTSVKPTAAAFSPARVFTTARPSAAIMNRPVVRVALPARIARTSPTMPSARVIARPKSPAPVKALPQDRSQPRTDPWKTKPSTSTPPRPDRRPKPQPPKKTDKKDDKKKPDQKGRGDDRSGG